MAAQAAERRRAFVLATVMPSTTPTLPARLLIGVVRGYRLLLSPWLGSSCRFEPTCSAYSLQALQTRGAARGSYLTLLRIGRCHPWCEGGFDPVPQPPMRLFQFLAEGHTSAGNPSPSSNDKTSP